MIEDAIIPLAVFASAVAVIWILMNGVVHIMRARTLREIARNSPESLDAIAARLAAPPLAERGETIGLLGMALGAALALGGLIGAPEARTLLLQAAMLPGFMGAALFARRWLPRAGAQTPQPSTLSLPEN